MFYIPLKTGTTLAKINSPLWGSSVWADSILSGNNPRFSASFHSNGWTKIQAGEGETRQSEASPAGA